MYDLAVLNGSVYCDSEFKRINIYISNGKIEKLSENLFDAEKTIDADRKKIIPGIIDPHVHFELNVGKYTSADNFYTGSAAGAYGGVTTFIDFLDPVTKASDVENAFKRRLSLAEKSITDFSFHVTAANPVNETEYITSEALRLKMPSIKIFTAYSESGRRTYEREIAELLNQSGKNGTVVLIHAENEEYIRMNSDSEYSDLSLARPAFSETSMIIKLTGLNKRYGGKIYVVHTTCGSSVEYLKKECPEILNKSFFIESCPHYFYLDDTSFKKPDGNKYILAPPLRDIKELKLLKESISSVFSIGTDHCPFLSAEKDKKYLKDIPFGIGGIEYSFPLMYSLFNDKIIDRMTLNPAKIFGLYPEKGIIAEGSDADFFIYNEKEGVEINENHSNCDYNLYDKMKVNGFVETTVAGGSVVMSNGIIYPRQGQFIHREAEG
jgi:dihydropyrimidinase